MAATDVIAIDDFCCKQRSDSFMFVGLTETDFHFIWFEFFSAKEMQVIRRLWDLFLNF